MAVLEDQRGDAEGGGGGEQVGDDADLYAAGLTSFASVQLMLGIEEAFDIDFPDNLLDRKSFASISAIARTVDLIRDSRKVA